MRDDDIDIEPDEFFGVFLGAVAPPVGIAELDLDVLTFRVAKGDGDERGRYPLARQSMGLSVMLPPVNRML
jgi:hypothetical protein